MKIKTIFENTKKYTLKHKAISILVALAVIAGGYNIAEAAGRGTQTTKYTLATATDGTILTTVSGSGQISATNQVVITSKVSGAITSLPIADGDAVTAGQLIATIDDTDALRSLESAQISLAKLEEPATAESMSSAQDAVNSSYESGLADVSTAFLNLPTIVAGIDNMIDVPSGFLSDESTLYQGENAQALRNEAESADAILDEDYKANLILYKSIGQASSTDSVATLVDATYKTAQALAETVKDAKAAVDYIQENEATQSQSNANTAESNLTTWTTESNQYLSSLQSDENNIIEKGEALTALQTGADPLDVQSSQLSIASAQETYSDYFIRAPIDGIISLSVKPTDTVSSGTTIGTVISNDKIATISLNEVDAAKVQAGDKATLTFDALTGFSVAGTVTDVSLIGAVSQGVVTYTVTIALDTNDPRIKPGMSVDASIVTDVEQNVLTVPVAAIKTVGSNSYVQELPGTYSAAQETAGVSTDATPINVPVTTALSNDTEVEITSGLTVGDEVITKTTTGSTGTTAASAPSLFSAAGARTTGGGAARATTVRGGGFGG